MTLVADRQIESRSAIDQDLAMHGQSSAARVSQAIRARGFDAGAAMQAGASLIWIAQAWLIAMAVHGIGEGDGFAQVLPLALAVLVLGIIRAGLDAAGARASYRKARQLLGALRGAAIARVAARSPLDPTRPVSGAAAGILAEQAEALVPYLSRFRPNRLKATVVPLVILAVVFPLSWAAGLVLLIALPPIPIFMALVGWRAKEASEAQVAAIGGMNGFLLDRLRGLATIRALGATEDVATRVRRAAEALKTNTMAVLRIAFLSSAVLELFAALGVAMVAVYVGFHLLGDLTFGAWGSTLTLGEGLFILLLAPAFFEPMRDLAAVWHDRANGEAAAEALDGLGAPGLQMPRTFDGDIDHARAKGAPAVDIDALSFAHGRDAGPALADVCLAIRPGEHVALTGRSGSGKTTLLSLIAGLAVPGSGEIRIGGLPLNDENAGIIRARIGWIGQKPHFYSGSMLANVTLGRSHIGHDRAVAALTRSGLGSIAPQRQMAEGGAGLSGGEGVRLAIARAIADPSIGLILADEPTAHLDRKTADEVIEALLALAKGRTLIVATHDSALAARLDRTIELEAQR